MNPQTDQLILDHLYLLKRFKDPDHQQEAFFGLREAAINFNNQGNFVPYARRIIRWRLIDKLRTMNFSKRKGTKEGSIQLLYTDTDTQLDKIYQDDLISKETHFNELVECLPISKEAKDILIYYFIHNFTFREIAEIYGICESGIYLKFKKIIQTIKECSCIKELYYELGKRN